MNMKRYILRSDGSIVSDDPPSREIPVGECSGWAMNDDGGAVLEFWKSVENQEKARTEIQQEAEEEWPVRSRRWESWRDVDRERGAVGFLLRSAGAEVSLGKRVYRVRWGK